MYTDRDKNTPRHRYLVTSVEGEWCNIRKFVGESLRASSYKVKRSELYKVPSDPAFSLHTISHHEESDEEEQSAAEIMQSVPSPPPLCQPSEPTHRLLPSPCHDMKSVQHTLLSHSHDPKSRPGSRVLSELTGLLAIHRLVYQWPRAGLSHYLHHQSRQNCLHLFYQLQALPSQSSQVIPSIDQEEIVVAQHAMTTMSASNRN